MSAQSAVDDAAVAAVQRFAATGDSVANQELLHRIDHSLDHGGTDATQTLAPQLLQWALSSSSSSSSPTSVTAAAVLYVAVLNRHYCLRVVLDRLAQPLDRRPCGLVELQQLYLAAARQTESEPTRRQLTQCVACLLIVVEDRLADHLEAWIRGAATQGSGAASEGECRLALHVFMAVVDLLVDRRVPIGSIRRATQRRQLQERLSIVLSSPLASAADAPLLLRATATAVRFLLEAMYGEPQEVAAEFWAALPTSTVWCYCLAALSNWATPCPADVLDFVCEALRCLTLMDASAEALLQQVLPTVLQPVPEGVTVDWAAISRVIAAALEASTEAIVTEQPPDSPLFTLFSAAAERLVQVLHAAAAPPAAVSCVCEGISALTQVLQPAAIPAMEPTDDPEDFAEIVECMQAANATKQTALERLRPFLQTCEAALATRLVRSGFGAGEWRTVAAYLRQRALDKEADDFQITHDEVELALFTTYERLSRLLGALSPEQLRAITQEPAQQLVLVTVTAESASQWLQAADPAALLEQAMLLPGTVARYLVGAPSGAAGWSAETSLTVMDALLRAITHYGSSSSSDIRAETVLEVADAAAKAALAVLAAGYDPSRLQQACAPLVSLLWRCAVAPDLGPARASARHASTRQLALLLQRGVAALPDAALGVLTQQDAYTQAVLIASGSASNAAMDTAEAFAHALSCLSQLAADDEAAVEELMLPPMTQQLRRHCEAGDWPAEGLAAMLDAWHAQHPPLVHAYVTLAAALPAGLQPPLLSAGLSRFFSLSPTPDVSTATLAAVLTPACALSVASTAPTASTFASMLRWLLQPHPSFTIADGGRRVKVLAVSGRCLCESGHVGDAGGLELFLLCVTRWREFAASTALRGPASGSDDDEGSAGGDDGASAAEPSAGVERQVLEELAVWGRRVAAMPALPAGAPDWLASLQCAQDDYERVEVLKSL